MPSNAARSTLSLALAACRLAGRYEGLMMKRSIYQQVSLAGVVLAIAACGAGVGTPAPATPPVVPPTPAATLETHEWDLDVGGRTMHLLCIGPMSSDHPTVVFEGGLADDARGWHGVMSRLASTDRGCAYDRAGTGRSEPAPAPRTTEDQVEDLAKLLKAADIRQPIILVAWSLGGWNAMVYADRHPDDVAGLVLIDVRPPTASARWLADLPAETAGESEALAGNRDEFTTFELDPSLNPEGLDLRASSAQAAAAKYGGRPVTFLWAKNTADAWEGLEPELAARLDRVLLDMRAEMEVQVAGATSIVVDASHDIAVDNPDAVIEAIRSLLAKV
jgi:pimeloyl-ACP methyl ester carboxylesterase